MSETFICSICGCETPLDERHIFDGRQLCDDCFEDETVICDCCENRDSLGDTPAQQEDTIARILFFVENNWNELLKFSRRTVSQMQQWRHVTGVKIAPRK